MARRPRHDGCVKPKRASRKTVEEPLGKRGEERKVPEESDKVVKKRRGPSVSKPAQEDQPQSEKKTAGSAGRSRGLQPVSAIRVRCQMLTKRLGAAVEDPFV